MKKILAVSLLVGFSGLSHAGAIYYADSNAGNPWGQTNNEASMDGVFGVGGWIDTTFETTDANTMFSAGTDFVYLEGGDSSANELEAFLTTNLTLIEGWVTDGGRLFVNSAPNEGDGMSFGFGVTLNYPDFDNDVTGVDPGHAIFNGPFGATGNLFSGSAFSHATVAGADLMALIVDNSTGNTVLGDMFYGNGYAMFGGMTTLNFQEPNAFELRQNILHYVANVDTQDNGDPDDGGDTTDVPAPAPLALLGLGLAGMALRRKQ